MLQDRLLEALLMLIPSGLLTTLIYLYLNAGKPSKQVIGHIILAPTFGQKLTKPCRAVRRSCC